jgi:hypothetical protein
MEVWNASTAFRSLPTDELFRQQAKERVRKKREALLHQIQRLMHERAMLALIIEPMSLHEDRRLKEWGAWGRGLG